MKKVVLMSVLCLALSSCAIIRTSEEVRVDESRKQITYENDQAKNLFVYKYGLKESNPLYEEIQGGDLE